MAIVLNPTDGLRNVATYPTNPATEAAAREQVQSVIDQVITQANAQLANKSDFTIGEGWGKNNITGRMEQRGVSQAANGSITTINFPISFPNNCDVIIITQWDTAGYFSRYETSIINKSSFGIRHDYSAPVYFYWMAKGY